MGTDRNTGSTSILRGKVGSLCRRRQIADRHILNHAAKRADLGRWKLLSEGLGFENPRSSQTGGCYCDPSSIAALVWRLRLIQKCKKAAEEPRLSCILQYCPKPDQ